MATYTNISRPLYGHTLIYTYVHTYLWSTHNHTHVYTPTHTYIHTLTCIHIYSCVHTRIHTHTHTHTHIARTSASIVFQIQCILWSTNKENLLLKCSQSVSCRYLLRMSRNIWKYSHISTQTYCIKLDHYFLPKSFASPRKVTFPIKNIIRKKTKVWFSQSSSNCSRKIFIFLASSQEHKCNY